MQFRLVAPYDLLVFAFRNGFLNFKSFMIQYTIIESTNNWILPLTLIFSTVKMADQTRQSRRLRLQKPEEEEEEVVHETSPGDMARLREQAEEMAVTEQQSQVLTINSFFKAGHVASLQGFKSAIRDLKPRDRFNALSDWADKFADYGDTIDEVGFALMNVAKELGLESQVNTGGDSWGKVKAAAVRAERARDEKSEATKKLKDIFPGEPLYTDFPELKGAKPGYLKAMRGLAVQISQKKMTYNAFKDAVSREVFGRVSNPAKGRSSSVMRLPGDFKGAAERVKCGVVPTALTKTELSGGMYGIDANGLFAEYDEAVSFGVSPGKAIKAGGEEGVEEIEELEFHDSESRNRNDLPQDEYDLDEAVYRQLVEEKRGGVDFEEYQPDADEIKDIDEDEEEDEEEEEEDERVAKRRKTKTVARVRGRSCLCGVTIPSGFISQLKKGTHFNEIGQSQLIKKWKEHDGENNMCYQHSQALTATLKMKTKGLSKEGLVERLNAYHHHVINSKVGDMKTDDKMYQWFHKLARGVRQSDTLGPYKYFHSEVKFELDAADQQALCTYLGIDADDWDQVGSVNIDMMQWWKTTRVTNMKALRSTVEKASTIFDVGVLEFDMYDHHLRLIDGKPNYGWNRTMFHSLIQQVMRQDPAYYAAYCALRGDRNTNLILYPYYTKYQREGDSTFFQHIDVNIHQLVTDKRGLYQIQGTVSLDDERQDDCTVIVPGMHRYIEPWGERLRERARASGKEPSRAFVEKISDVNLTKEDLKEFGNVKWTSVPCKALQARITQPHLPHGAKGPAKRVRRTMLPWFVGLQKDLHHLEIHEGGSFEELSAAHRDLVSGEKTPSGLANNYGDIPYAFPAAVKLDGLGALSDALVGRIRHDNVAVLKEKRTLLKGTDKERNEYLVTWRKKAVEKVVKAFAVVVEFEKEAFGSRSFFLRREKTAAGEVVGKDEEADYVEGDVYSPARHGQEEGGEDNDEEDMMMVEA